jgi:hypothetical protein
LTKASIEVVREANFGDVHLVMNLAVVGRGITGEDISFGESDRGEKGDRR